MSEIFIVSRVDTAPESIEETFLGAYDTRDQAVSEVEKAYPSYSVVVFQPESGTTTWFAETKRHYDSKITIDRVIKNQPITE